MSTFLTAALAARQAGFSVIPVRAKIPAVRWEPYMSRIATAAEVRHWFQRGGRHIGYVCGRVSGNLEVVDVDEVPLTDVLLAKLREAATDLYDRLTIIRTRSGGLHIPR